MINRVDIEKREVENLSSHACFSRESRGRLKEEKECDVRTIFQHDRDRILHSKAFRRLKHKTQVFIIPEGDHYRTRLTHTLEVSQIARTIARALGLNEDLTEAIALGHDLGHTPFGHAGEAAINEESSVKFTHNEHSLRVVDKIEDLNLSFEVRDGIKNHTGDRRPATLEGQIVRIADRIAYINHDIDDALRGGIITTDQIPENAKLILGKNHSERINVMVRDMINSSWNQNRIKRSPGIKKATQELRQFLFEKVYIGSAAKKEENKAVRMIKYLFRYYLKNPCQLSGIDEKKDDVEQEVIDYIAGMTDRYAINRWRELFLPSSWNEER